MNRAWRLLLILHAGFGVIAGPAYLVEPPARGRVLLAAAAGYVGGLLVAARRGAARVGGLVDAAGSLSVLQVLPDWALVEVAGTLAFPDLGAPRVGDAADRARTTRDRLLAAPAVALLYTGALFVSLLLLDRGALAVTG